MKPAEPADQGIALTETLDAIKALRECRTQWGGTKLAAAQAASLQDNYVSHLERCSNPPVNVRIGTLITLLGIYGFELRVHRLTARKRVAAGRRSKTE